MIRKLDKKDKENWAKLYSAYADFYKVTMNTGILDTLWEWIHDESHIAVSYTLPRAHVTP